MTTKVSNLGADITLLKQLKKCKYIVKNPVVSSSNVTKFLKILVLKKSWVSYQIKTVKLTIGFAADITPLKTADKKVQVVKS